MGRHGGLLKGKAFGKRRKVTIRNEIRDEILKAFKEELKEILQDLLEALMYKEWKVSLEEHPTKASDYYTRGLLTIVGPLENLWVPIRKGISIPKPSPVSGTPL